MSDEEQKRLPLKFNLNTPEGRKRALQRIIEDYGVGKATASDAKGALQVLLKLEGDISDQAKDELKADPYSVMKVFLRAEGLTAVESLREKMSDDSLAEGVAKVLGAVRVGIKWKDGGIGRYVDTNREEPKEEKTKGVVNEAQGVENIPDARSTKTEPRRDGDEPEQKEGESA